MYGWIWRRLPGGRATKTAYAVLLIALVLALMFLVVFPAVEPRLPWNHPTVGAP